MRYGTACSTSRATISVTAECYRTSVAGIVPGVENPFYHAACLGGIRIVAKTAKLDRRMDVSLARQLHVPYTECREVLLEIPNNCYR